jgi:hypothetical protein
MPTGQTTDDSCVHRHLWTVVTRLVASEKDGRTASFQDDLVIMLFAFHTLEAYLNYAGAILHPELWNIEKRYFNTPPYQGFDGKIRKIFELCRMPEPSRASRPYATIWKLTLVLDTISHATKERQPSYRINNNDELLHLQAAPFHGLVTHDNALLAAADVETLIRRIHAQAGQRIADPWFQADPFAAIDQHAPGLTTPRQ